MTTAEYKEKLENGYYNSRIKTLYGEAELTRQKKRIKTAVENFEKAFPDDAGRNISIFSAPGRTEIGGNHTDHQHGCVLAAAVHLDIIGIVHLFIDFGDPENPQITNHLFDFETYGYAICITNTKGSHSDLSDEYSQITDEMKGVANELGCDYLRDADEDEFYRQIPRLREVCSDRAVLRAMHFFDENRRAQEESQAISNKDMESFLKLVQESGDSSANLLQNISSLKRPCNQNISLALALSRHILRGNYYNVLK